MRVDIINFINPYQHLSTANKQKKPHRPEHGTGASSKTGVQKSALRFGVGALFAGYQYLTAIVQVTFYHVGMVEKVLFSGRLADRDVRGFRFVVRAAGALPALGVPPFRIWHDLLFFGRGWKVEGRGL